MPGKVPRVIDKVVEMHDMDLEMKPIDGIDDDEVKMPLKHNGPQLVYQI